MKKILIIIAAVLVVLFLAKDFIAGSLLTLGVSSFTDLSASVQHLSLGVFKSAVDVKGFKLYNPPKDFRDRVMVDMPGVYISYYPGSFLTGTKHLKEVKLNIKEFVVVKNANGKLNLDCLKPIQAQTDRKRGDKNRDKKFKIDVLELKIDKVIYKDYSRPGEPVVKEFNIGVNERYANITDPYSFASLVVFKALANTSIASLAHFDLSPLKSAASDALVNATKNAVGAASEAVKKLLPFGK
ncbi:MAG: hypothetical protein PHX64_05725 [Candidatus Omnitrophica bacterium]|nr:hypothetical protein [Candidatus Omnitrophota bacterium]MDD5311232.1 hypothetical protein [Candidatus Omnitrophota bacterium]MDD5545735.1 hypothetical protein [Candidatus Omnitrophota bacterium]